MATMELIEGGYMENARKMGELHFRAHQRLAKPVQGCRRCARQGIDDRH